MVIAKEGIDPDADKILRRLRRNGHAAFLVGGCVRDLLLGRKPKDFDIATSATPPEIKDLFRNCRIIGRRFRLAHIFFGSKIIETSTFRSNPREGTPIEEVEELLIRRDNVFGTAEEDARRRDFTINGLFYDIEAEKVTDYVGGIADLEARMVRAIGDPDIRFREDPVRILRAIKFAARLDFQVEPASYAAMLAHRGEIPKCAAPRVLEEIYRLLRGGAARRSMELLLQTGVAATLAPELAWMFGHPDGAPPADLGAPRRALPDGRSEAEPGLDEARLAECRERAWKVLDQIDALTTEAPSNALLLAALVAPFVPDGALKEQEPGPGPVIDQSKQIEGLLVPLVARLRVSRRDAERARQVLLAQARLVPGKRRRARPMALVKRDYFGEALGLYEMMNAARGSLGEEAARWRAMWVASQQGGAVHLPAPAGAVEPVDGDQPAHKRRRRRRGGKRRRKGAGEIGAVIEDIPGSSSGS